LAQRESRVVDGWRIDDHRIARDFCYLKLFELFDWGDWLRWLYKLGLWNYRSHNLFGFLGWLLDLNLGLRLCHFFL
jgi:hypothetical protein